MIQEHQTIRGPVGGRVESYFVTFAGKRTSKGQRVRARRQSEGVGGMLMEAEITLTFPDPENIEPWEVVKA